MSARALKCTHKQTHIVWPIEEAFSGWNQNNLAVFCRSPLWRRSVSLQYFLPSFSHQYCLKSSFFFFNPVKVMLLFEQITRKEWSLECNFFITRERNEKAPRKMKIGQTQCPSSSYGINEFLILLWQLWVREKEGWMERELMEAEICRCHSFLNSWLKQQMWSRYIIALLCRAKTA